MTVKIKSSIFVFLFAVWFFVLGCSNVNVFAQDDSKNSESIHSLPQYKLEDYVVDSLDVDITVNEDNTFNVVEKWDVYFNVSKHGLIISWPVECIFLKPDGSSVKYRSKMYDISVNDNFEKYKKDGNQYIKIGSSSKTIKGQKNYIIKYTYSVGVDKITDMDQLYYNIVGDNSAAPYGNVTFTITMPKDFDASKLGFIVGEKKGNQEKKDPKLKYSVDGNKITGRYDGILEKKEALTVRCELPKDYFKNNMFGFIDPGNYILIGVFLFLLLASGLIYFISLIRRPGPLIKPVEFYPPDGLNSLDVAYIYKEGRLGNEDVTSFLVYLANKGYIKILQQDDCDGEFKLEKLKEYDGGDENEREFLEGIFESGKEEVYLSDLYDNFYKTAENICENVDRNMYFKIFKKFALVKFSVVMSMVIVSTLIAIIANVLGDITNCYLALLGIPLIFIPFINNKKSSRFDIQLKVLAAIWAVSVGSCLFRNNDYVVATGVGLVCAAIMILFAWFIPKRTKYGYDMLGRIKGFRNFLVTAEKDKLEALVMEDPQYFYNILPYTYVLGVSKKWIEKFETIALKEPDWYNGADVFDVIIFNNMVSRTMDSMIGSNSPAETSTSWGSGGDSGTGGGVAGGGYGGGSSSSW